MELDLAQPTCRALVEEEIVVPGIVHRGHGRILRRREEVVRHELDDQRDVDVHRAFELWERTDIPRGHREKHVPLEPLGRDDVPQQVDDLLALGRHLHLHRRVVEQVAAVGRRRDAHVVGRAQREELHGDQPRIGVGEHLAHVGEVGDGHPVEAPARGWLIAS